MNSKCYLNNIQLPFKICILNIKKNAKAIQCDLCNYRVHIECNHLDYHCVECVQVRSFFWSVFFRIWTEYGEIWSISPYSVRMQENTDQKKTLYLDTFHAVYIDYKYFQGSNNPWICATCCSATFPFASLNNNYVLSAISISCDRFNKNNEKQIETKDTSLLLNPSPNSLTLGLKWMIIQTMLRILSITV